MKTVRIVSQLAVAAVALAFAGSAHAQSLNIKKIRAAAEARIQKDVDAFNKACGTTATFAFDWKSFGDDDEDANNISDVICEDFVKEVSFDFCGAKHDLEQKAVQEKIKKLSCAFLGPNFKQGDSSPAAKAQKLVVKGGTATYSYARWAGNKEEYIRKELGKQL
jgi:hypothetical protein